MSGAQLLNRYAHQMGEALPKCPGCGFTKWLRGRVTAECSICAYPIDLEQVARPGERVMYQRGVPANMGATTGERIYS